MADQSQTGGKAPAKGVLGFCALLLKTCEYDAAPVFQKLLDSYRGDLSVDESLFGVSLVTFHHAVELIPPQEAMLLRLLFLSLRHLGSRLCILLADLHA